MARCKVVKFMRKRAGEPKRKRPVAVVKFCASKLSPKKMKAKKDRARKLGRR